VLTLQPFRLLSIVKWTGYLLIGWLLAEWWRRPPSVVARPLVAASLLSVGGTFPVVTAATLSTLRLESRVRAGWALAAWTVALVAGAVWLWMSFGSMGERVRLVPALLLVAAFSGGGRLRAAGAAGAVALVLLVASNRSDPPLVDLAPLRPVFTLDDIRSPEAEIARAAGLRTPADAIFVAPPDFGILRLVGRRALVVDFEAVPLQDREIRAWRQRIRAVYGEVDETGFAALDAFDRAWRATTDEHLHELARRYGATHAILYGETPTALPTLYASDQYRVVSLGN
jgi:hypothetical protein